MTTFLICFLMACCAAIVCAQQMYPTVTYTGIVEEFTLVIARQLLPGHNRYQVTVNGTVPGPSLRVTLGNTISVKVVNEIYDDVTTVHWHGITMRGTPWMDGLANLTQCPISNVQGNNSFTYTFTADMAGTYWYHGHMHSQYPDGLYGALVITDPHELPVLQVLGAGYQEDSFILQMADYYLTEARYLTKAFLLPGTGALDPIPDSITVNNAFTGKHWVLSRGVHRIRLINAAAYSPYELQLISGSTGLMRVAVVEIDGSPTQPKWVDAVTLYTAQRASIIVDLTAASSVMLRVRLVADIYPQYTSSPPHGMIGSTSKQPVDLMWIGWIDVEGTAVGPSSTLVPSLMPSQRAPLSPSAADVNMLSFAPLYAYPIPAATHYMELVTAFYLETDGVVRGYINEETYPMGMDDYTPFPPVRPTLYDLMLGNSYSVDPSVTRIHGSGKDPFILPYGAVVDVLIDGKCCGAHPFHLHGHHFWVLASNQYNGSSLIRDVVTVPFGGWVLLRIVADNPGIWILHCHLHWHFAIGLAALIIEAPDKLQENYAQGLYDVGEGWQTCKAPMGVIGQAPGTMPSAGPTVKPSQKPSITPSKQPSRPPTRPPTRRPSRAPSRSPTVHPTILPSSATPSWTPSAEPSAEPSAYPSKMADPVAASMLPTMLPTLHPTAVPSHGPSLLPSLVPTHTPSHDPSHSPSAVPTALPSLLPSFLPSLLPSHSPTHFPSATPTHAPHMPVHFSTHIPTHMPSRIPTVAPCVPPTAGPVSSSHAPSRHPSRPPAHPPSLKPSVCPTRSPTVRSSAPSRVPTRAPTVITASPSAGHPTPHPSPAPSVHPSTIRPTASPATIVHLLYRLSTLQTPSLSLGTPGVQAALLASLTRCQPLTNAQYGFYGDSRRLDVDEVGVVYLTSAFSMEDYPQETLSSLTKACRQSLQNAVSSGNMSSILTQQLLQQGVAGKMSITAGMVDQMITPTVSPTSAPSSSFHNGYFENDMALAVVVLTLSGTVALIATTAIMSWCGCGICGLWKAYQRELRHTLPVHHDLQVQGFRPRRVSYYLAGDPVQEGYRANQRGQRVVAVPLSSTESWLGRDGNVHHRRQHVVEVEDKVYDDGDNNGLELLDD